MIAKPIAVIQGAEGAAIRRLLSGVLTAQWRPARIAGVLEEAATGEAGDCGLAMLRNIGDGRVFPLFQDLGPGSTACAVDPAGVADACDAVCRDVAAGCDLVVLNKFGKLEAENGSGLTAAFAAALAADIPILTAVSPRNQARWDAFAAPYYTVIEPSLDEIAAWFGALASDSQPPLKLSLSKHTR